MLAMVVPCRFREGIMKPMWIAIFFTSAIKVRVAREDFSSSDCSLKDIFTIDLIKSYGTKSESGLITLDQDKHTGYSIKYRIVAIL